MFIIIFIIILGLIALYFLMIKLPKSAKEVIESEDRLFKDIINYLTTLDNYSRKLENELNQEIKRTSTLFSRVKELAETLGYEFIDDFAGRKIGGQKIKKHKNKK